jgi:hypothetical protein
MKIYDVVYSNPDCNGGGLSNARDDATIGFAGLLKKA